MTSIGNNDSHYATQGCPLRGGATKVLLRTWKMSVEVDRNEVPITQKDDSQNLCEERTYGCNMMGHKDMIARVDNKSGYGKLPKVRAVMRVAVVRTNFLGEMPLGLA